MNGNLTIYQPVEIDQDQDLMYWKERAQAAEIELVMKEREFETQKLWLNADLKFYKTYYELSQKHS